MKEICTKVGQADSDKCLFETRTAFDCLARHKVRKYGDMTDNQNMCRHHIANMKAAFGEEHAKPLQETIDGFVYMRRSFI